MTTVVGHQFQDFRLSFLFEKVIDRVIRSLPEVRSASHICVWWDLLVIAYYDDLFHVLYRSDECSGSGICYHRAFVNEQSSDILPEVPVVFQQSYSADYESDSHVVLQNDF